MEKLISSMWSVSAKCRDLNGVVNSEGGLSIALPQLPHFALFTKKL